MVTQPVHGQPGIQTRVRLATKHSLLHSFPWGLLRQPPQEPFAGSRKHPSLCWGQRMATVLSCPKNHATLRRVPGDPEISGGVAPFPSVKKAWGCLRGGGGQLASLSARQPGSSHALLDVSSVAVGPWRPLVECGPRLCNCRTPGQPSLPGEPHPTQRFPVAVTSSQLPRNVRSRPRQLMLQRP